MARLPGLRVGGLGKVGLGERCMAPPEQTRLGVSLVEAYGLP